MVTPHATPQTVPLLPGAIDRYVATNVPICHPEDRIGDIREQLSARSYASAKDVAVCVDTDSGRRLEGMISIELVLAEPADTCARDVMDTDPPVVTRDLDEERAAWKAVRHGQSSLAVSGTDGEFHGLVPPGRLLGVLLREHDEDLARLGGFMASTSGARHATEERLRMRLWHRIPWLLIGLVGSALAAIVVRGFEGELSADLRLAFFLPGIIYMADAVGTQTEALVIRGMSVGVTVRRVVWSELLTGVLIGTALGTIALLAIAFATQSVDLALVVGLSLFLACSVATVVAMALPAIMAAFKRDPAFGSGPLATVLQDLLSIMLYFAVATAVLA